MSTSEKDPTLIFIPCFSGAPWSAELLTPSHDVLIGEDAAKTMLAGIPDAREGTLPRTGHMFSFSHPVTYAAAVQDFLATVPAARQAVRA